MMLELSVQQKKVFVALASKIFVHFSDVQMNEKILRTSFSPGLLSLFLFPHKSQMKHHAILDRLALAFWFRSSPLILKDQTTQD